MWTVCALHYIAVQIVQGFNSCSEPCRVQVGRAHRNGVVHFPQEVLNTPTVVSSVPLGLKPATLFTSVHYNLYTLKLYPSSAYCRTCTQFNTKLQPQFIFILQLCPWGFGPVKPG
jgi:hypothetical protein